MFCTKCGKKIEEESIFCEFCGMKQVKEIGSFIPEPVKSLNAETAVDVPKEIINEELKKIADHLEFLGYKIEKLEVDRTERIIARHTTNNSYFFFQMIPGFLLFQVSLSTDIKHNTAMDAVVNQINKELGLSRFYYDIGKEDSLVVLRIEAVYVGSYLKEEFALFQERFEKEQAMIYQIESFKVFLNK